MKESTRFERAKKEFNDLVWCLGIEYFEITDEPYDCDEDIWNIRDMVSELQFELDKYYMYDTMPYWELHSDDPDVVEDAKLTIAALKKFINKYKNHVDGLKCVRSHCSKWDN